MLARLFRDIPPIFWIASILFTVSPPASLRAASHCLPTHETISAILTDFSQVQIQPPPKSVFELLGMPPNDMRPFIKFAIQHGNEFSDDVIDIPAILSDSIKKQIYDNFNHLSLMSGTGELGLNFYTEIKLHKYLVVFCDGIGVTTIYMLLALIDNVKQILHYRKKNISDIMLDDCYYTDDRNLRPHLYINTVEGVDVRAGRTEFIPVEQTYLRTVQRVVEHVNHENLVSITYLNGEHLSNRSFMTSVFESSELIESDGLPSMNGFLADNYRPVILSYFGKRKHVSHHWAHGRYTYFKPELLRCLLRDDLPYSVVVYPVVERNKRAQNGALKIIFLPRYSFRNNTCK